MSFRAGSADEMAETAGEFALLPNDEYLATVTSMTFDSAAGKPATQYGPAQDQYVAALNLTTFADGSALEDTDGNSLPDYDLRVWINHNKMGMVPQPSKARKFFAACLGQPLANSIEIANFPDDLIGKKLYVSTLNKKTEKGEWTRAQDFRPLKIERKRAAAQPVAQETEADTDSDEIQF